MYCWTGRKTADPLRRLRARLFALNLGFASAVVLTLCFFGAQQAQHSMEAQYREAFAAVCAPLQSSLVKSQTVDHKEIYQYAIQNDILPIILDGQTLLANPYFTNEETDSLPAKSAPYLDAAKEQVAQQSGAWIKTPVVQEYTLVDGSEWWFAQYQAVPTSSGQWLELYLFQSGRAFLAERGRLRLLYFVSACTGIAALGALSFWLTTWAMRPAWKAQQAEREFVAAASHELKSPLTVITTAAELLPADDPQTEKYRAHILSESRRMTMLVQELLSLAKSESATCAPHFEMIETEAFLWDIFEAWEPVAAQAGDSLNLCFSDDALPPIRADEELLRQLFSILLSNAVGHTPVGTAITVSAQTVGRSLCFSIADNGPGIREKEKVFDKFYRENKSRTEPHFGLGLSIAQRIVLLHHGKIGIQDTKGGGATIRYMIPIT